MDEKISSECSGKVTSEIWRDIPNSNGMKVSNHGNVMGRDGKVKRQDTDFEGYKRVTVNCKHVRVHRIVAEVFIDNPQNKPFVNHKNGKKWDNRTTNLEWCTPRENSLLASKSGRWKTAAQRREIIAVNIKDGTTTFFTSQAEAARHMKINNSEICKCLKGKRKTSHGNRWYYMDEYMKAEGE